MLGFYPTCPGLESYQLGIPTFEKAVIHLNPDYYPAGNFVIKRMFKSEEKINTRNILLNDEPVIDFQLKHRDIVNGGKIVFEIE